MILINEIRFPNYVSYKSEIKTIAQLYNTSNSAQWEPIPLTPELLVQCGFKKEAAWPECYSIAIDDDEFPNILTIDVKTGEALIHYNCIHDSAGGKKKIQYLHQLQNLYFALTGEELVINL